MADKQPCLCIPSCTKELGQVQCQCHHKQVQAVLGCASDSSDARTSSDPEELPTDRHCVSNPVQFYQDDSFPAQDLYDDDVDHTTALNNELANDDWSGAVAARIVNKNLRGWSYHSLNQRMRIMLRKKKKWRMR